MIALFLLACATPVDSHPPVFDSPDELEIPSLSDIDFKAAIEEAFIQALAADTQSVWSGHSNALAFAEPGCPDLYAGTPNADINADFPGVSWYDECSTGNTQFTGFQGWSHRISAESDPMNPSLSYLEGERQLFGQALVRQANATAYAFDGEAFDAIYQENGDDYSYYAYSSYVNGTVSGTHISPESSGYRTEMYVYYTGGAGQYLESRGNLYWMNSRIADRFDSVAIDLEMTGSEYASSEDCALEPRGWIGVRDENAYWYEVVFEPRYDSEEDYSNDPYTACDGCGELYIRGLPQGISICPDFSTIWSSLSAVDPAQYALVMHPVETP